MRNWMRLATPFALVIGFSLSAQAQMYGVGLYGGMQACPYPYGGADGSSSYLDEIADLNSIIREAQSELRDKRREVTTINRKLESARKDINDVIEYQYAEEITAFMDNRETCSDGGSAYYEPGQSRMPADGPPDFTGEEGEEQIAPGADASRHENYGSWKAYCRRSGRGRINPAICNDRQLMVEGARRSDRCSKAISDYPKLTAASQKLATEIENLEELISRSKEDISYLKKDYRDEMRDKQREQMEGGICIECLTRGSGYSYERPQTDWGSVVGNVGLGLLASYMGHRNAQMISENNATIGWPTQPYPAVGYGMPYFAQGVSQALGGGSGIYGAIGGGIGQGGFGCAGNNGGPGGMMGPMGGMNAPGMWGNPYAMYPGMGGGMYNPGMGPWGGNGPWGGMGGGMGGGFMMGGMGGGMMGMPMGGMSGGMMGMPMGGYMGGGMMGGMAGGMMGMPMGGMSGGMMGMPMGGYMGGGMMGGPMGGGFMMGGMAGGMMGTPMGGMSGGMMGMPMGGYMGGGMMGGPMGGGFMMGGMAGGMMGMPMGGYMGGGMAGGMMGGYMGGMMGDMQMQQQMMQMQMQQYQYYAQMQQQQMQQQMAKQQTLSSLQMELYGLMNRIQQVQMGGGFGGGLSGGIGGGGYIGGGIGGVIGVGGNIGSGSYIGGGIGGGASGLTPLPGSPGNGSGGGGGTAPIPAPR